MILQDKKMNTYERYVSEFKGLNRLPVVADGELMSCENMVFDLYPAMSTRNHFADLTNQGSYCTGLLATEDKIYIAIDSTLIAVDVQDTSRRETCMTGLSSAQKSIVKFWNKIYVFPDKKYYDIEAREFGDMGSGTFPEDGSVPDIDYAIVHNNRIWGVKGSYIYASANGWAMGSASPAGVQGWVPGYDDAGYPNDIGACWFEVASDGDFTGISSWDDRIVALKRDMHYEVTGSLPSNYELSTVSRLGAINNNTICEVNGKLYYLSPSGVQSYGGGYEVNVSRNLNENWGLIPKYSNTDECMCGAGSDGTRYYLSCTFFGSSRTVTYVYDTNLDVWTEYIGFSPMYYSQSGGLLYGMSLDGDFKAVKTVLPCSETVNWSFSFSDYDGSLFRQTKPVMLVLKLRGEIGAKVAIEMTNREGEDFEEIKEITLTDKLMQDVRCPLQRGGEHIFRVSGTGDVIVYGYYLKTQDGGSNNA